jgi:polar amino acid transport system substrate-binding protein
MNRIKFYWVFLLLTLSHGIHAKELLLVAGLEKPPYVVPAIDSGFEIELMQQMLSIMGYEMSVVYVPYGRTYEITNQIKADIGLTLISEIGVASELLTDPYVVYQNVAVSLKQQKIQLTKVAELQNYSLVAFQNANKILGADFAQASKASPLYFELPDQLRQVELLLQGKIEVIVMDVNIFKHFAKVLTGNNQISEVNVHSLFPSTYYRAVIASADLRQTFNQEFSKYIKTEQYAELLKKYDMPYLLKDRFIH